MMCDVHLKGTLSSVTTTSPYGGDPVILIPTGSRRMPPVTDLVFLPGPGQYCWDAISPTTPQQLKQSSQQLKQLPKQLKQPPQQLKQPPQQLKQLSPQLIQWNPAEKNVSNTQSTQSCSSGSTNKGRFSSRLPMPRYYPYNPFSMLGDQADVAGGGIAALQQEMRGVFNVVGMPVAPRGAVLSRSQCGQALKTSHWQQVPVRSLTPSMLDQVTTPRISSARLDERGRAGQQKIWQDSFQVIQLDKLRTPG